MLRQYLHKKLPQLYIPAKVYRTFLRNVTFIGVTGSCGKTTTKDFTAAILSAHFRVIKSGGNFNMETGVINTVLKSRFWHRFTIMEIATREPGTLDRKLSLLKPHIGIVTNVRNDHYTAFRGRENVRSEKVKMIRALPASGLAILNADDPLVITMKKETQARVITYGQSEQADVRASDVTSNWPSRLSFTVSYRRETVPVQTRLLGIHLAGSALAALSAALALGISLSDAAVAFERIEPTPRRMNPVVHSDNVTFIRDDVKAPWDSLPEILEFMKTARASRKIAIIGTISDYPGSSGSKYRKFAREASAVMDKVIFVGRYAPSRLKKLTKFSETKAKAFKLLKDANDYLSGYLQPGDLVIIKASGSDHLWRLALNRERHIGCWSQKCAYKPRSCEDCRHLYEHWAPDDIPGFRT